MELTLATYILFTTSNPCNQQTTKIAIKKLLDLEGHLKVHYADDLMDMRNAS